MKHYFLLIILPLFAMAQTHSNDTQTGSHCSGKEISLDQFQWENRIIVIFTPDSNSEPYQLQMNKFTPQTNELLERDLILISVFEEQCATLGDEIISTSSTDSIRSRFSTSGDDYSIFLFGKDGGVKLRKADVLEPEELFRVIDRMPMRQREMRDGR